MIITYFSRGADFSIATMKSSVIAFVSGVVYVVMIRYAYLSVGIILGTILSSVVSIVFVVAVYKLVIAKFLSLDRAKRIFLR